MDIMETVKFQPSVDMECIVAIEGILRLLLRCSYGRFSLPIGFGFTKNLPE